MNLKISACWLFTSAIFMSSLLILLSEFLLSIVAFFISFLNFNVFKRCHKILSLGFVLRNLLGHLRGCLIRQRLSTHSNVCPSVRLSAYAIIRLLCWIPNIVKICQDTTLYLGRSLFSCWFPAKIVILWVFFCCFLGLYKKKIQIFCRHRYVKYFPFWKAFWNISWQFFGDLSLDNW